MKTFIFQGDYFGGLFSYLRNSVPSLISYVQVTSATSLIDNSFCIPGYSGGYPSALIDGSQYHSWSNQNFYESEQEVKIDLGTIQFHLKTFALTTPCGSPNILQILGSNDDITYDQICTLQNFQQDYSSSNNTCDSGSSSYRIFKLKQIGANIGGTYRLHISEIEFFGTLNPVTITCNCHSNNEKTILFVLIFIFINKK